MSAPPASNTFNFPTICATTLPAHMRALTCLLSKHPLPTGFRAASSAHDHSRYIELIRGRTTTRYAVEDLEGLRALGERRYTHILELTSRALAGCFGAARLDFLSGSLSSGTFHLVASSSSNTTRQPRLVRIARIIGLNPRCAIALDNLFNALKLLTKTTLIHQEDKKPLHVEHLVSILSDTQYVSGETLGDGSRGGEWRLGCVAPELFERSLIRFIPVDYSAFELQDHKTYNTYLAALAQVRMGQDRVTRTLRTERLLVDAGLTQASQSGPTRAKSYLTRAFKNLIALGLIMVEEGKKLGSWLISLPNDRSLMRDKTLDAPDRTPDTPDHVTSPAATSHPPLENVDDRSLKIVDTHATRCAAYRKRLGDVLKQTDEQISAIVQELTLDERRTLAKSFAAATLRSNAHVQLKLF